MFWQVSFLIWASTGPLDPWTIQWGYDDIAYASQAERSEESKVENHGGSLQRWQGPYWWNSLILGYPVDLLFDGESMSDVGGCQRCDILVRIFFC